MMLDAGECGDERGSDKCGSAEERAKKNKTKQTVMNAKWGLVNKNVGGFLYKPRGGLVFLALNKTSRKTILTGAYATPTSSAGSTLSWMRVRQLAEAVTIYKVLKTDIFSYTKHQFTSGGFHYHPESCGALFMMYGCSFLGFKF